jgi:hypothetical protein
MTPSRAETSRINGAKSHGPITEQGRRASALNATKHGLTATHLVIAAEDQKEFDEFLAQLQTEIRPDGALQKILFDQLVVSAWNLRRIRRMEAELTAFAATYLDILDNLELTAKLDRLARHHTRIERTFHRSLRELKSLQTDAALAVTLPKAFMRTVPPLASKTQIAKRTQALAVADRLNEPEEEYWSGADAEAAALLNACPNLASPPPLAAAS